MWLLWLVVGITFSVTEIIYRGNFLVCFAISSFITLGICFLTPNSMHQFLIFIIISVTLLVIHHKKSSYNLSTTQQISTVSDSLKGKKGVVIKSIMQDSMQPGVVKVDGEMWHATSVTTEAIPVGSIVLIDEVKGVRLIVSIA